MKTYYYISGTKGMTSSGSFTSNKSRWIVFDESDLNALAGRRPYGATKSGLFIPTNKYY